MILHLSGRIGLIAYCEGSLATLDHIGVPQQDQNRYHHENHSNRAIKQVGFMLLGLFLRGTGDLWINGAAGGKCLAVFLFSGCTHECVIPLIC